MQDKTYLECLICLPFLKFSSKTTALPQHRRNPKATRIIVREAMKYVFGIGRVAFSGELRKKYQMKIQVGFKSIYHLKGTKI